MIKSKNPKNNIDKIQSNELLVKEKVNALEDTLWNIFSENITSEFEANQEADEFSLELFTEEENSQRLADSLAEADQLAEFEANQEADEFTSELFTEEENSQRLTDSLAEADQLAEFEANQRLMNLHQNYSLRRKIVSN